MIGFHLGAELDHLYRGGKIEIILLFEETEFNNFFWKEYKITNFIRILLTFFFNKQKYIDPEYKEYYNLYTKVIESN